MAARYQSGMDEKPSAQQHSKYYVNFYELYYQNVHTISMVSTKATSLKLSPQ